MNRIIVPQGTIKKLEGIFNASRLTIRRALTGDLTNVSEDRAKRIRKAALENGGVEVVAVDKN